MRSQAIFFEDIIDESVEMHPMHPVLFDDLLSEGWRLLGRSIVRHNFSVCRGKVCGTIPLRIRLDGFSFSSSQRKLLRKNAHLLREFAPIQITEQKEQLFQQHADRFHEKRPDSVASFLGKNACKEPVQGMEFNIFNAKQELLACSFIHLGEEAVSGTYCFFDPELKKESLGTYTMLLEIEQAIASGKKYYYHGYRYDVPSQFDYKSNFHNLEAYDWKKAKWVPVTRVPVRRWVELVEHPDESI